MSPSPDDRFAGLLDRRSLDGWSPDDDDEALDDLLPASRPVPRRLIILIAVGLAVAGIVAFVLLHRPAPRTAEQAEPLRSTSAPVGGQGGGGQPGSAATVHVVGAVRKPGVVRLPPDARVADAIAAAGGASGKADQARVNLARKVVDGEQIVVPAVGEQADAAPAPGPTSAGSAGGGGAAAAGDLVNINTADEAGLDELPGVGPATAKAIIGYRDEHGPFASVDALTDVPGIGEVTLEKLRPLITV